MVWVPWFFAWLVAFNTYKIITAFRTGKIGMHTAAASGHTYSRATEPWGFYRAIVLLVLFYAGSRAIRSLGVLPSRAVTASDPKRTLLAAGHRSS